MANKESSLSLTNVISSAIQIPGIKKNREAFLREQFKNESPEHIELIIEKGPVEAHCSREQLRQMARALVTKRTVTSSGVSFVAGLPGGLAMAATIPADVLQFYAFALGLAQEIAYLYGEEDLWSGNKPDEEKVTNQLILYCGVMLGASGAAQTVRVMSSALAKQALKKLPQKALTKTFYYPIVKSVAKAFGARMTKSIFAKGVSKAVPIIGGVVSGGITFASMRPMGMRLIDSLDKAHFAYEQSDFEADWQDIVTIYESDDSKETDIADKKEDTRDMEQQEFSKEVCGLQEEKDSNTKISPMEELQKAKQLLDSDVITEEEFTEIKAKLIAQM